jgi:CheY-like chemotaxis protein
VARRCVLLCESEAPVARTTVRVLARAGYDADHVHYFADARERLCAGSIDLVIIDAPFIDSVTCDALVDDLGVESPTEVLFTTCGFDTPGETGFRYSYVLKPWYPDTLLDAVRGLIG